METRRGPSGGDHRAMEAMAAGAVFSVVYFLLHISGFLILMMSTHYFSSNALFQSDAVEICNLKKSILFLSPSLLMVWTRIRNLLFVLP